MTNPKKSRRTYSISLSPISNPIHEWLSLYYNISMTYEQQAQLRYKSLYAIMGEDIYSYIESLPAIMTQKQYDDTVKQNREIPNRVAILAPSNTLEYGKLDALSIIDVGGEAIALGSVSNKKSFLTMLESEKPVQPLIIAMDNDESGGKTQESLRRGLERHRIVFYVSGIYTPTKTLTTL